MTKKKNIIFSIIFMSILIFSYFVFISKDENTKPVFEEEKNEKTQKFDYYYVEFNTLTTKNFDNIISKFDNKDFSITKIYTTPNPKYNEELIEELKEYSFDNINDFVEFYIKKLDEYKYDEDINNVNVYGVKIDKILIYTTRENLKSFSKKVDGVKYRRRVDNTN